MKTKTEKEMKEKSVEREMILEMEMMEMERNDEDEVKGNHGQEEEIGKRRKEEENKRNTCSVRCSWLPNSLERIMFLTLGVSCFISIQSIK